MSEVEPIVPSNAGEVAAFLHKHLNPGINQPWWEAVLSAQQPEWADNHGFLLRAEETVVGCYAAIYAE